MKNVVGLKHYFLTSVGSTGGLWISTGEEHITGIAALVHFVYGFLEAMKLAKEALFSRVVSVVLPRYLKLFPAAITIQELLFSLFSAY